MNKNLIIILSLLLFAALTVSWDCEGAGSPSANVAPVARLSNIPPNGYFLNSPIDSLSWVGDDPDGFVTGFKYRWSYTITTDGVTDTLQKAWFTILNVTYGIGSKALVLMVDTALQNSERVLPGVYKYFANLRLGDPDHPELDLPKDQQNGLYRGDTITVLGVRIYASNPDSTLNQATGRRELKRYPVHTNPNKGVFVFDSQDSVNFHDFQIQAIDNLGALGPVASVTFYTSHQPPPVTILTTKPGIKDTFYVRNRITDTFRGIRFVYHAVDPNSRTREYQWVVDRDLWPSNENHWSQWSEVDSAFITANDFYDPYATNHTFYVRSKNEFGSIDTLGYYTIDSTGGVRIDTVWAQTDFHTIYPEFARPNYTKRTLLLNNSYRFLDDNDSVYASLTTLNNFYKDVMRDAGMDGKYDLWTTRTQGFPSYIRMAKYSCVILFSDVVSKDNGTWYDTSPPIPDSLNPILFGRKYDKLFDYTRIGGKMIFSGRNFALALNVSDKFLPNILHCVPARDEFGSLISVKIKGAIGLAVPSSGTLYPTAILNPNKLAASWYGRIWSTSVIRPIGFGEKIFQDSVEYSVNDTTSYKFRGRDIGVRYQGITYSTVYLGYPLYYMREPDAVEVIKTALQDIGE